ncbi:hybrid sensor histidine kinase/response regulator [Pseudomonas sichuanensis]|uniref:hybrid sensor histidine kinase/response regulator n=1 Tax=Pseudomonas TaxID=286 RepID=UPI00129B93A7|nr:MULTISPECIES: hybrid sensor histidine kinase/response regulator [Pseudomonas]MDH0732871.1 hybrid sensor histidine kinase/response regulator [Pseudomonas sichuanensis]MDH1582718.1 hybrid sensor histidine kinase/response regulator [Pseudomonas sichuanensis]MDH1592594.1 hybrid sensor histidine kinase/response regulator [Pseudomonas sichuanensis]MDH1598062.1 hybrid sensor histidine kinase/response regulator [Pseudomonas sichuanensis]MDU9405634.1 hybrid sensor histidine kinase/response regulator
MLSNITAKLLIVDDLPENLLALGALIQGEDREVHQAQSAEQALSLLLDHEFALAILDVQMPGMNGFELAELMRGMEKTRNVPIVFVTAAGREMNYAFKGYESGAVDFLHKPLDTVAVKSKVSVFIDLFRQRKALDRQLQALEHSRAEQEQLLAQLQVARGELEHAVRMRDDFMSIVSHEVRTPLNGLILETQLRRMHLSRGNLAAFSEDKLKAMVERDERQINSLIRLVEDMLDVSRIRTGKLSIRPKAFDLGQLVQGLVQNFSAQASALQTHIELQRCQTLHGEWDEFRIEQVLANLLSNALRYGERKPVQVRLFEEGAMACVQVQDSGIGISAQNQQRIFQQFERVAAQQASGGLGLGLYISEQIVLAHGGRIQVDSAEGSGATFSVYLPLPQVQQQSDHTQATSA